MADFNPQRTEDCSVTYPFSPGRDRRSAERFVLLDAARCWHRARQRHQSTQPALSARLKNFGCEQLAPVIDSLMTLGELVLGHPFRIGTASLLSEDEHRLLDLYEGRHCGIVHECSDALAHAFCHALLAARIMMGLELTTPKDAVSVAGGRMQSGLSRHHRSAAKRPDDLSARFIIQRASFPSKASPETAR